MKSNNKPLDWDMMSLPVRGPFEARRVFRSFPVENAYIETIVQRREIAAKTGPGGTS